MVNKIIFYNHYHNGDIFISKEYIRQIMSLFPEIEYSYYHSNSPKLLKDLNIKSFPINQIVLPQNQRVFIINGVMYINTWIGAMPNHSKYGCTFVGYNYMWLNIYKTIATLLQKNIPFGDKYHYIPDTNYDYYDVPKDFKINYDNTILFSNGNVNSGQSFKQDTDYILQALLDNFKDKIIILTHKTNIKNNRILYTDEIIKTTEGDLNEISWIAERCKYLIGRNSGPFIFMHTKTILNDINKNIISFGTSELDVLPYAMKIIANYDFFEDNDSNLLINNIISHIKNDTKNEKMYFVRSEKEIFIERFE